MVDLKDLKGYSQIGKPILCPAHPAEELRLFCELCDQPVCRECMVGGHREHPCDLASNVVHKHGDSVRELLKGTQPHVEALEKALAQIDLSLAPLVHGGQQSSECTLELGGQCSNPSSDRN